MLKYKCNIWFPMKFIHLAVLIPSIIVLSACDSASTNKDSGNSTEANNLLVVSPLPSCSLPSEANVTWNLGDSSPSTKSVQVFVKASSSSVEKLFSEGGRSGKATTGKWAKAGKTSFILKDKLGGKIFSEVSAKGPGC